MKSLRESKIKPAKQNNKLYTVMNVYQWYFNFEITSLRLLCEVTNHLADRNFTFSSVCRIYPKKLFLGLIIIALLLMSCERQSDSTSPLHNKTNIISFHQTETIIPLWASAYLVIKLNTCLNNKWISRILKQSVLLAPFQRYLKQAGMKLKDIDVIRLAFGIKKNKLLYQIVVYGTIPQQKLMANMKKEQGFNSFVREEGLWLKSKKNNLPDIFIFANAVVISNHNIKTSLNQLTGKSPGQKLDLASGVYTANMIWGFINQELILKSDLFSSFQQLTFLNKIIFFCHSSSQEDKLTTEIICSNDTGCETIKLLLHDLLGMSKTYVKNSFYQDIIRTIIKDITFKTVKQRLIILLKLTDKNYNQLNQIMDEYHD